MNLKLIFSSTLMLAVATCSAQQLDAAANAACALATAEANTYATSTDPKVKMAVGAVSASCADPSATAAQVNAARVVLKNALKGA